MCFRLLQRMKFCFIASCICYSCFLFDSVDSTLDIIELHIHIWYGSACTNNKYFLFTCLNFNASFFHSFGVNKCTGPYGKWMSEDIGYTILKGITHQKWNAYELFANTHMHTLGVFVFGAIFMSTMSTTPIYFAFLWKEQILGRLPLKMEQFVDDKNNWKRFSQSSTTRWTTMANQLAGDTHTYKKNEIIACQDEACASVVTVNRQSNILSQ